MPPSADSLLSRLSHEPVLGVDMSAVTLLRLDLKDRLAPGNKRYKLRSALARARRLGIPRLVSFGGAWSNHLHALAAVGREQGLATVGIVRGEEDTAMLADASAWGMTIVRVSRTEYRRRNDPDYLHRVERRFAPCLVIPEGGASDEGARGCMEIARLALSLAPEARRIVLPVGTGTTLAGVAAGLGGDREVVGVAALKGATDLEQRVQQALGFKDSDPLKPSWHILHGDHCGGFARVTEELRRFIPAFEAVHGIPLDPVYTGKMMLAIHRRLHTGEWPQDRPLLAIHTGGLQGRRGFDWLG